MFIWSEPSPVEQHGRIRAADGGAHRRREAEAHRAEAAGVDPAARLGEVEVLRGPHLVLADVRVTIASPPVASMSAWTMYCGLISVSVESS